MNAIDGTFDAGPEDGDDIVGGGGRVHTRWCAWTYARPARTAWRVKTHVGTPFTKLGARDRAAAIVFAYDSGLVRPRS